jgi:hypothetical protein
MFSSFLAKHFLFVKANYPCCTQFLAGGSALPVLLLSSILKIKKPLLRVLQLRNYFLANAFERLYYPQ